MALSEEQIVRYSRQILLTAVGGAGQEKLLGAGARLSGRGAALLVAASYLGAGGSAVQVPDRPIVPGEEGFLIAATEVGQPLAAVLASALGQPAPEATRSASQQGALVNGTGGWGEAAPLVFLGGDEDSGLVLYRGVAGCRPCFELTAARLDCSGTGPTGERAVLVGALGALAYQRLVLGIGPMLGGLRVAVDGSLSAVEIVRCPSCGP